MVAVFRETDGRVSSVIASVDGMPSFDPLPTDSAANSRRPTAWKLDAGGELVACSLPPFARNSSELSGSTGRRLVRRLLELVENSACAEGGCIRVGINGAALATRGESPEFGTFGWAGANGGLLVGNGWGRDAAVVRDGEEVAEVAAGRIGDDGAGLVAKLWPLVSRIG